MTRNKLKIIACVSMLLDHTGYLLFPQVMWLRYAGRLAFPLFAFFIGEGCRYTHSIKKYFLQIFLLGAGCQAVYIADDLITNKTLTTSSDAWYFNILLTFSLAVALCSLLPGIRKTGDRRKNAALFAAAFLGAAALVFLFYMLRKKGMSFRLDYGISGLFLPVAAALFQDKKRKTAVFAAAAVLYCVIFSQSQPYVWFSLVSVVLLLFYNGKPGSRKFKYFFYVFYPAHLAALYLISLFL